MLRFTPVLLLALFLLSACGMQRDFHQRRYLPGKYFEKTEHALHERKTHDRETELKQEPVVMRDAQGKATSRGQTDLSAAENKELRFSPAQALKEENKNKIRTENRSPEKSPGIKTDPPARHTTGDQPGSGQMSGDFYGTFFTILIIGMIAGGIYLIVAGNLVLGIILVSLPVVAIIVLAIIVGRAMDKAHRQMNQAIRQSCDGCGRGCSHF